MSIELPTSRAARDDAVVPTLDVPHSPKTPNNLMLETARRIGRKTKRILISSKPRAQRKTL